MSDDRGSHLFGRRRRENDSGGARVKFYKVKVSAEEQARLEGLAIEQRVTVSRLLVESTLADGPESISERRQLGIALNEVRQLLANVANNANQVAKFANSERHVPEWARTVVDDYRRLRPQLNAVVDGLIRS